jgi:HAMP domain-containing protein
VNNDTTETIDITPTWVRILPAILAVIQNGTPQGRAAATAELQRLAETVDAMNAAARTERENRNLPKADPVEGLAVAMANTYRADTLQAFSEALETAMDDAHHFARDSDDGGTRRRAEADALARLANLIALAQEPNQ